MSQPDAFEILLGPEFAAAARSGLQLLNMIPEEKLVDGINRLGHLEAVGPIFDPSAWTSGDKFGRSDKVKKVLDAMLKLRRECEEFKAWETERTSRRQD